MVLSRWRRNRNRIDSHRVSIVDVLASSIASGVRDPWQQQRGDFFHCHQEWWGSVPPRVLSRFLPSPCENGRTTARDPVHTRDELTCAIGWSVQNINKDGCADDVRRLPNIWQNVIRGRLYWREINIVSLWIKPYQEYRTVVVTFYSTLISIIKEIAITSKLIRIHRWNQLLLQSVKTGIFFTLCSINLNMVSISGTGNIQPIFNLYPCVMKHLRCNIVDSSINSFFQVWQITILQFIFLKYTSSAYKYNKRNSCNFWTNTFFIQIG